MRKYVWLIGILVIALLVVPFVVGCGNKQQSELAPTAQTAPTGPPQPGAMSAEKPTGAAGEGANALGDLMKKQGELSSYAVSMEGGAAKTSYAMKMANDKPVAMKMETGQGGWMIIRFDKKMHYMYNPATKSVMSMAMTGPAPGATNTAVPGAAALKALVGQKVTSETVDGVDCMKVASTDGKKAYWIEKEHGLPVQVKDGDKTMKFKYEQINSVPDSTFEVPAGTKTMSMPKMPSMPGGMPNPHGMPGGMPKMPK